MSVPLDRLYNYIEELSQKICNDDLIIYQFYPHGSKKLENLTALKPFDLYRNWFQCYTSPVMICHDQEPLKYDLYSTDIVQSYTQKKYANIQHSHYHIDIVSNMHLRAGIDLPINCYDICLLTHSEKNSQELQKYENHGFIGIYWWCHAIIARDWFRYAEHITLCKKTQKTFLIYNRAWSGSREYRLKFVDLLISQNLQSFCQTSFNNVDPETNTHYTQHKFENLAWKPSQLLEHQFDSNTADSNASADFCQADYEATDIEVVLETLFDDSRIHLTEKILRPIALGQPFILVSTPGSLEFLQSYGFKTFDQIWSEDYDKIGSAQDRLECIIDLMQSISSWSEETRGQKMQQAQQIANYNKKLFFSQDWQEKIFNEYAENFDIAWQKAKQNRTGKYVKKLRSHADYDPSWAKVLSSDLPWRTKEDVQRVELWLNQVNQ